MYSIDLVNGSVIIYDFIMLENIGVGSFRFYFAFTWPIWIAKCLRSFGEDFPETFGKTTAQEYEKSTSSLSASIAQKPLCLSSLITGVVTQTSG